jgi:hypothetical protein
MEEYLSSRGVRYAISTQQVLAFSGNETRLHRRHGPLLLRLLKACSEIKCSMPCRSASSTSFRKPCTLCSKSQPILVKCQIDSTGSRQLVCPGKCWKFVSGGTVDAAGHQDEFPYYRSGSVLKNKHELVSAKMKKKTRGQHEVRPLGQAVRRIPRSE